MSDPLAEALALLDDALTVQRFPCRHKGIGMPGCVICDPRVYPGSLAALAAAPETARCPDCSHVWSDHGPQGCLYAPKDEADVSCVCTEPDAKSTASDARVSHDTLTVERLAEALHKRHGIATVDPTQCVYGWQRDLDEAAAILAALGEEKP